MDIQETHSPVNEKKAKLLSTSAHKRTEAKLRVFLENYAKTGRVLRACEAAGIDHNTHYRKLQADPTYRAAVEEAEQQVAQQIEDRVYDMAMDGELQAALALLKRFRPNLYRERASLEVSGSIDLVERMKAADQRLQVLQRNDPPASAAS
jgi:tRNA A37 N6-isopentenylltransferase MiaA